MGIRRMGDPFPSEKQAVKIWLLNECGLTQHQIAARFGELGENPGRVSQVLAGKMQPQARQIFEKIWHSLKDS